MLKDKLPRRIKTRKSIYNAYFMYIFSVRIEKLKGINVKLRNKLKELNQLLEKTLEKANTRKIYKNKDANNK